MTPYIGTRSDWDTARRALLVREKELTRLGDALAAERQALPWVPVDKVYTFDTEDGPKTLEELFGGRSQLIVYHFMFGPDWDEGCPSCSSLVDHMDLARVHLEHHDVAWVPVSRAPLATLLAYRERMGWTVPWASSSGSDFNVDFHVSGTDEHPLTEHNFRELPAPMREGEAPGMSAFVMHEGVVHHTYSAYARGLDAMWGMYQWLDRAPLGRNETPGWMRRHDAYEPAAALGEPATA
ncbi:MAG: thioredoxin [Ilumatobacteraceae bacterium]|nr:thioredoxin [Ilumatobacteraceae bacterium]